MQKFFRIWIRSWKINIRSPLLSRFHVGVPILWVRTGNLWVRFEPMKRLKNPACVHGRRNFGRNFSRGALVDFPRVFLRGTKSDEFCFLPLETKKTAFFAAIFKFLPLFRHPCLCVRKVRATRLKNCSEPKYLGVTLDRSPTYRRHPSHSARSYNITRRTPEEACWLRLGRWSNKIANSNPSPGPFNCTLLRSCLVPQC